MSAIKVKHRPTVCDAEQYLGQPMLDVIANSANNFAIEFRLTGQDIITIQSGEAVLVSGNRVQLLKPLDWIVIDMLGHKRVLTEKQFSELYEAA